MRSATCIAYWLLLLGVTACAPLPQIHQDQLIHLDKGLAPSQVVGRLGLAPLNEHRAHVRGREFVFHQYRINNGMHSSHYLVAFEGQRLVYWGYLDEFRRQPDGALSQAVGEITSAVLAVR